MVVTDKALGFYLQRTNAAPALEEVDRLYRALIHDPAVGYVPPFTVIFSVQKDYKARFIFTRPEFAPPQSLLHDFPKCCNAPSCVEKDCGAVDWEKSLSLAKGSPLVRDPIFPKRVKCNLWPCKNEEPRSQDGSRVTTTRFMKCSKCLDVLYCSRQCQVSFLPVFLRPWFEHSTQTIDWNQHKRICQARPAST